MNLKIAYELDPDSGLVHCTHGLLQTFYGDLYGARKSFQRSLSVDPLSAWTSVSLAKVEYFDHKFDRALTLLNELIDREPTLRLALYYRALTLSYLGRYQEALVDLHKTGFSADLIATDEAWIHARSGQHQTAKDLLARRLDLWRTGKIPPASITILAIAAGETKIALESIDAFSREKHTEALNLRIDPRFDPIRGEPAFSTFLARNLPDSKQ